MKLFKYEGFKVVISEEALLLKPFKDIWDNDTSEGKDKALQELAYIYFMEDPRSDYQFYVDRSERSKKIIEGEGLPKSWKPSKYVTKGLEFYSSFKSPSALLLEDVRYAVDNMRKYLRELDPSEVDERGKPIHTLNSIMSTLKMTPSLIHELSKVEVEMTKEQEQLGKLRGQGEKTLMDDGIVL